MDTNNKKTEDKEQEHKYKEQQTINESSQHSAIKEDNVRVNTMLESKSKIESKPEIAGTTPSDKPSEELGNNGVGNEQPSQSNDQQNNKQQPNDQKNTGQQGSEKQNNVILALRTTVNREDQVIEFIEKKAKQKKLAVYGLLHPHGMRGYVFIEGNSRPVIEQAVSGVPYARGLLKHAISYKDIEHLLEKGKKEIDIQKNDIAEIIVGPFKREKCKVVRIDKAKGDVVVQLLEAAVPIPITVKIDNIKVIRRESSD